MRPSPTGGDFLYGTRQIAHHLGIKPRQAHYLAKAGRLPHFQEGRIICGSRTALNTWLVERSAAGPVKLPKVPA